MPFFKTLRNGERVSGKAITFTVACHVYFCTLGSRSLATGKVFIHFSSRRSFDDIKFVRIALNVHCATKYFLPSY